MSRTRDYILATIIGLGGLAALYVYPAQTAEEEIPVISEPEPEPEPTDLFGDVFTFLPPGDLAEGSGTGQASQEIYVEDMRFPVELPAAYANSQVYGVGGLFGEPGSECAAQNYAYPWRDNFCETRQYATPFCPSGTGHQGQDIRPARCPIESSEDYYAVAAASGDITGIGTFSVFLLGDDGTRYTYLHLEPETLLVEEGDRVERGERLGVVSNAFGDTATTYHLHFEITQSVEVDGILTFTKVPPYLTLVDAYERLLEDEAADEAG